MLPDGDGLLLPGPADDFVQAIRTLQSNPAHREELRRKARARSEALAWTRLGPWMDYAACHLSNIVIASGQEMSDLINQADYPKQSSRSIEM